MDLVCVDVTDLPDGAVHRGDQATFIGAGIIWWEPGATITKLPAFLPVVLLPTTENTSDHMSSTCMR